MGIDAMVVRHRAAGAPHRIAGWIDAVGGQRGRRSPRAPDPGAARRVHAAPPPRRPSLDGAASRSSATSATRGSRAAPSQCCVRGSAPRSRSSVRRRCCPSASTAGRSRVTARSRRRAQRARRRLRAAGAAGAHRTGAAARACASTTPAAGSAEARAARMKPDTLVMHPGPMIRGAEIATEVVDGPRSLVREQVANGVAVRMAVLWSARRLGRRRLPDGADHPRRPRGRRDGRARGADVLVRDGVIAEVGAGSRRRRCRGARRRGCGRRARARRHPGALPRARPRGGGDDRDRRARRRARRVHRGRRDAEHRRRRSTTPRWSARCSSRAGEAMCHVTVAGLHHRGPRRRASSRRSASCTTSACACSPTTATAWRTPT